MAINYAMITCPHKKGKLGGLSGHARLNSRYFTGFREIHGYLVDYVSHMTNYLKWATYIKFQFSGVMNVFGLLLLSTLTAVAQGLSCNPVTGDHAYCACTMDDGSGTVNISSLANNNYKPRQLITQLRISSQVCYEIYYEVYY